MVVLFYYCCCLDWFVTQLTTITLWPIQFNIVFHNLLFLFLIIGNELFVEFSFASHNLIHFYLLFYNYYYLSFATFNPNVQLFWCFVMWVSYIMWYWYHDFYHKHYDDNNACYGDVTNNAWLLEIDSPTIITTVNRSFQGVIFTEVESHREKKTFS